MPKYIVQPGDFPALIARKIAGNAGLAPQLIMANPGKRRAVVPGVGVTFATLRPGEILELPASWGRMAGLGLALNVDTGAQTLSQAQSNLQVAINQLSAYQAGGSGAPTASDVISAFNTAAQGFLNAATQASTAANTAQNAIVAASSQGQSDPAAVQAQNDYNAIQGNLSAINGDVSTIASIDLTTQDPTAAANDAQNNAQSAVSSAQDAVTAATNWGGSGSNPPSPGGSIPTNVVSDAQAVLAAINADANYCTSVGQSGTAVNTTVHNFKVDWNAAGLSPTLAYNGLWDANVANAVGTAIGGQAPGACTGAPAPVPPPPVPVTPPPPAAPATATNYTPWLIAGAIVLAAGIGYAVYRNRHHPTVQRARAVAGHAGRVIGHGARHVGHAVRRGVSHVSRRVAAHRSPRRLSA